MVKRKPDDVARIEFTLQRPDRAGGWISDSQRYVSNAEEFLQELEAVASEVVARWPFPPGPGGALVGSAIPLELWDLARKRDRLSDSVRIFAAMAVEAFLNLYGVVRMGEAIYQEHFERLGLVPKLRQLLLICDSIVIEKDDPLVQSLSRIANGRNALVHPKASEADEGVERPSLPIPGAARDAFGEMRSFFEQFAKAVPTASHLSPLAGPRSLYP